MKYEYDENKSLSNKQKHAIDFEEAKELWNDNRLLEIKTSFSAEERYVNIGKIKNKFYTAVITYREDKVRIISIRRSRQKEIEIYES
ncbi:MAG: toxin [Sulfurovum sp.]|nr:MAG: toxin [Sulfurovum sp.]